MSSETNSGSGDAYGRAVENAYREHEYASSPEPEAATSSSGESSRQMLSKDTSERRTSRVDKERGKGVATQMNPQSKRSRSIESFVSHRLNVIPPPIPAVIATEIPMMEQHSGQDMRNLGSKTTVSLSTLEDLSRSIPWPAGIELCLPERGGTSLARYEDCLVIFVASVEAVFRLPLPDFYRDFLRLINLSPTQLYPNAWRYLCGYTMRCYHFGLSPSVQHMLKLFTLKYNKGCCNLGLPTLNVISKPSNVGKWKDRWFLERCSSHTVFNCTLHPCPFMRPDKPDQKEIDACKNQFRNDGDAPEHKRVITQENLEKAGLSFPRSIGREKSSMKSDFLLERARKKASGSKQPAQKIASKSKQSAKMVEEQGVSEQTPAPDIDAVVAAPITDMTTTLETEALLLSPGGSVEAGTQGDKGDDPPQIVHGRKRSRPDISIDPIASIAPERSSFAAPVPSIADMKNLAPPDNVCVREREWLTSLPPRALQLECMKYAEMTRLGMLASTTYSNTLEAKCKRIREKCATELEKMNATVTKLGEERAKHVEEKAKLVDKSARFAEENARLTEENARLTEENMLVKKNAEDRQHTIAAKDGEMAELKRERDDWRDRAERAVSDYIKSDAYMRRMADEVGPHWEQGIRIGVRQAVAKFGEFDPSITYFTPDYTDLFGEPPIEDFVEEDNQTMDVDTNAATTSVTLTEDHDVS